MTASPQVPVPSPIKTDWAQAAEQRMLDAAIALAPEMGWGQAMVQAAGRQAGLSEPDVQLLLPGGGRDLAALLSRRHDQQAIASLAGVDPMGLKIRERIRQAVTARVEAAAVDEAVVRRATAYLAMPTNLPLGLSLAWESADVLWRWAGDTATDENHYSKRAILSVVLINTVAARFDGGPEEAAETLDRRIENVMSFEKWKAGLPKAGDTLKDVVQAFARMRYK